MTRHSSPDPAGYPQPEFLLLGEVLRPHGVRGELRIRILTDYPERILQLDSVFLGSDPYDSSSVKYRVTKLRLNRGYGLLKLSGVEDRDQADLLRKTFVMVPLEDAIPLEEGEFYLYQLIGLAVKTDDGQHLGNISDVVETGANDVYVVESARYGEFLIPATDEVIVQMDIEAGVVIVNLIEGLLPSK